MTYLDTHVTIWLYQGDVDRLSRAAGQQIERDPLLISPAVLLELEYLHEVKRLKHSAVTIIDALSHDLGLEICEFLFSKVVRQSLRENWVRDPFDRLIVSHAKAQDAWLITRDEKIRQHYNKSVW